MCFRYECLVEGCGGVYVSEYARQLHLVDKHQFPKYFDYDGMGAWTSDKYIYIYIYILI